MTQDHAYHQGAFSYCLKHHLDAEEGLQESIQEFLTEDETRAVMSAAHRPHYVLQKITAIIDSSELLQMHKLQMVSSYYGLPNAQSTFSFVGLESGEVNFVELAW